MSTQQRSTGERTEGDPSTGAALLPVLQILSLVCLAFSGLQFLFEFEAPRRGVWAGYVLATAGVVGIMWMARRRAAPGRARAACSVVVFVLLTGPALLGTIGFVVPVLIVAAALLVIDVGVRASLAGDAVASAALAALFPVLGGGGPREILLFAIPMAVLMSVGTALGLALSRYDAALTAQRRAIVERDAALEEVRRRAVLEKELMLAQERARAAHELHDGLGHRNSSLADLRDQHRLGSVDGARGRRRYGRNGRHGHGNRHLLCCRCFFGGRNRLRNMRVADHLTL